MEMEIKGEPEEIDGQVELSMNSVVGFTSSYTMKLKGEIQGHPVMVLIDCGATHNFIAKDIVRQLQLSLIPTTSYGVIMGTGDMVRIEGICKNLLLTLQDIEIIEDFLPFDLGSADVILGMQWLENLGMMQVNWKTLLMKCQLGTTTITLKGEPSLYKTQISLRALIRTVQHEGKGMLLECETLERGQNEGQDVEKVPQELKRLMKQYEVVMNDPVELPPSKALDHKIILKEGVGLVSVRPYRYPQVQKDEIEKLVGEMLAAGIIQPSHTPFSSPILLVKKKRW